MLEKTAEIVKLADNHLSKQLFKKAITEYKQALDLEEDQSIYDKLRTARIAYGDDLFQQQKFKQARKVYKRALKMDFRDYSVKQKITQCYLEIATNATSDEIAYNNLKSTIKYTYDSTAQARLNALCQSFMRKVPKDEMPPDIEPNKCVDGNVYYELGKVAYDEKNFSKAFKHLEYANKCNKSGFALFNTYHLLTLSGYEYALQLKDEGDYELAIVYFNCTKKHYTFVRYSPIYSNQEYQNQSANNYVKIPNHIAECKAELATILLEEEKLEQAFYAFKQAASYIQKYAFEPYNIKEAVRFIDEAIILEAMNNYNFRPYAREFFNNHKELTLAVTTTQHVMNLAKVLHSCPNIRKLELTHKLDNKLLQYFFWCSDLKSILGLSITISPTQYTDVLNLLKANKSLFSIKLSFVDTPLDWQFNDLNEFFQLNALTKVNNSLALFKTSHDRTTSELHYISDFKIRETIVDEKSKQYQLYLKADTEPKLNDLNFPYFTVQELYWLKCKYILSDNNYLLQLYTSRELEYTTYVLFRASTEILNQDSMKCIFRYLDDLSICSLKLLGIILKQEESKKTTQVLTN